MPALTPTRWISRAGRRTLRWGAAITALVLYLVLANDGRHHWHEWRHVYSAANYSVADLAAGAFDPGPPPERSSAESGAWYWGQLGHEAVLRTVIRGLGPGLSTAVALGWIYGLAMPLAVLFLFLTLRRLRLGVATLPVSIVTLLSPLTVYLGFKLMGEVPAFLFATVAGWLFTLALHARSRAGQVLLLTGAGLALAASFLCKVFMPLSFLGFALALAVGLGSELGRRRVLTGLLVVLAIGAVGVYLPAAAIAVHPRDWVQMYRFFAAYRQPVAASLFGILTAGSLLYAAIPFALLTRRRRALRFFGLWLLFTAGPLFLLATNFVEARYLAVALVPFAGLACLSLETLVGRGSRAAGWTQRRMLSMALILLVLPAATAVSLPFLPFEMSSVELTRSAQRVWDRNPRTALLIPWNYTDYHFLKFAFPDRPVYLVQSPVDDQGQVFRDEPWERRQARNYGDAFIGNRADMVRVAEAERVYLGQGILPPIQNLRRLAGQLHLEGVVRRLDAMQPRNHITESWMWEDPQVQLREAFVIGQYTAYIIGAFGPGPRHAEVRLDLGRL